MSYLSGNRGECGKNGVDFCLFRASYQHRVDNSVEKLHLPNESEANVESGGVEKFHAPAGDAIFEIAGMMTLPLRPKAVTPPLWNRAPRRVRCLQTPRGVLPRVPLLWNPPPARLCVSETQVSIARVENTKAFLFKERKLFVQTMDLWES